MQFTRYGTLKTVTILQEMAETVLEAGASGKGQPLHLLAREMYLLCVFGMDTTYYGSFCPVNHDCHPIFSQK